MLRKGSLASRYCLFVCAGLSWVCFIVVALFVVCLLLFALLEDCPAAGTRDANQRWPLRPVLPRARLFIARCCFRLVGLAFFILFFNFISCPFPSSPSSFLSFPFHPLLFPSFYSILILVFPSLFSHKRSQIIIHSTSYNSPTTNKRLTFVTIQTSAY